MKVRIIFSQILKLVMLAELFNKVHGTSIQTEVEVIDGTCFVLVNFGECNAEQIFDFAFQLGFLENEEGHNEADKYGKINLKVGCISQLEKGLFQVQMENIGIIRDFIAQYNFLMKQEVSMVSEKASSAVLDLRKIEKEQIFFFAFQLSYVQALHVQRDLPKLDLEYYDMSKDLFQSFWVTETGRDLRA